MNRREYAPDPEVEADRRRRDRAPTELRIDADPSTNEFDARTAALADHKRRLIVEPPVEQWPCRKGCGSRIPMTKSQIDIVADGNRKLVAKGYQPQRKSEVMICPDCRKREELDLATARTAAERRDRTRRQGAQLALGVTTTSKPRNEL